MCWCLMHMAQKLGPNPEDQFSKTERQPMVGKQFGKGKS